MPTASTPLEAFAARHAAAWRRTAAGLAVEIPESGCDASGVDRSVRLACLALPAPDAFGQLLAHLVPQAL